MICCEKLWNKLSPVLSLKSQYHTSATYCCLVWLWRSILMSKIVKWKTEVPDTANILFWNLRKRQLQRLSFQLLSDICWGFHDFCSFVEKCIFTNVPMAENRLCKLFCISDVWLPPNIRDKNTPDQISETCFWPKYLRPKLWLKCFLSCGKAGKEKSGHLVGLRYWILAGD